MSHKKWVPKEKFEEAMKYTFKWNTKKPNAGTLVLVGVYLGH